MVSSKTNKTISHAISLLVAVISLTGTAVAATAPSVAKEARYTPGFAGAPGKIAIDAAKNMYVADFWAKGVVKLDRLGNRVGFIPTASRPTAVAVMKDDRLLVTMSAPQARVAFYRQSGSAPNFTGEEVSSLANPGYRPVAITFDSAGRIYVLDAGDLLRSGSVESANAPCVRVYDPAGAYLGVFGTRTATGSVAGAGGDFKVPRGIAFEKAGSNIVVADTMNGRLQFFGEWNGTTSAWVKNLGSTASKDTAGKPVVGNAALLSEPVDVVFDYTAGNALDRVYVADRARGELQVVDPVAGTTLSFINGTTVTNGNAGITADMKLPDSLLFVPGSTAGQGVLYAGTEASSTGINLLALGIGGGTVQVPTVDLKITSSVPATTTTGQSPLTVSGTVSPVAAVNCSVNGGGDTPATPSGGNWSVDLSLASGDNYILCKAASGGVTSYAEAFTYYTGTPTSAPVPSVTSPVTGIYTNNADYVISGTVTPAAVTNIRLSNANNGKAVDTVSAANGSWSATVPLAENTNVITVSAWKTGTTIGTASVTINADYTAPNMTGLISFIANGSTTVNAVQNLDGIVVEKNLNKIFVNGVEVGAKVPLPAANNTYFSIPVTLVRGGNTISVTATDLAGNTSTLSRSVTLNPEIPGLTVDLPADNSYAVSAGTAAASGTVDPALSAVTACGAAVTPAGGTWSTGSMPLAGGLNLCQFTASATGKTTVSEKRTINVDAAYAQLAITNPPADLATSAVSVNIQGTVAPSSPAPTISVNGGAPVAVTSYDGGTGAYSHSVTLGGEGSITTVKVIADGNTAAVRNIIRDSVAPVISIQSSANATPAAITGSIEPSAKLADITTRLDGVDTHVPLSMVTFDPYSDQSAGDAVWHADLSAYPYSAVTFTTKDPAGNTSQLSFVSGIPTGDVDGDGVVRLSDAMATLRHAAGTETLAGSPLDNKTPRFQADVGGLIENRVAQDGAVTVQDAVLILLKAYGLKTF